MRLCTCVCTYMDTCFLNCCLTLQFGDTLLHVACLHCHPALVEVLLKAGADLKIMNKVCTIRAIGCPNIWAE